MDSTALTPTLITLIVATIELVTCLACAVILWTQRRGMPDRSRLMLALGAAHCVVTSSLKLGAILLSPTQHLYHEVLPPDVTMWGMLSMLLILAYPVTVCRPEWFRSWRGVLTFLSPGLLFMAIHLCIPSYHHLYSSAELEHNLGEADVLFRLIQYPVIVIYYIKPILDKYPQAVLLSGHTHFSMNNDRSILQDKFTMINMGVIHYMITDYGYWNMNEGNSYIPEDFDRHPQGSLFEVDRNGTTRIRNYDFGLGKQMGHTLILPAPGYKNSLSQFGWDRANTPGPTFPSQHIVAETRDGMTTVTVPRASGNGSQVLYYLVNITDEAGNKIAENHKYINDLLITAQEEDMANPVTLGLGALSAGHTYTVTVTACNVWGTEGDRLTTTIVK